MLVVLRSLSGFSSAKPCVLFHPNHPIGVVVNYTLPLSLTVLIVIGRTDPPDFVGGPNDYRAASEVTLTCQATGGSGTILYQWSSTCSGPTSNCFVPGQTAQTINRGTLRSTDSGNHTCTVSGGLTGSATIEMNVVGE